MCEKPNKYKYKYKSSIIIHPFVAFQWIPQLTQHRALKSALDIGLLKTQFTVSLSTQGTEDAWQRTAARLYFKSPMLCICQGCAAPCWWTYQRPDCGVAQRVRDGDVEHGLVGVFSHLPSSGQVGHLHHHF